MLCVAGPMADVDQKVTEVLYGDGNEWMRSEDLWHFREPAIAAITSCFANKSPQDRKNIPRSAARLLVSLLMAPLTPNAAYSVDKTLLQRDPSDKKLLKISYERGGAAKVVLQDGHAAARGRIKNGE